MCPHCKRPADVSLSSVESDEPYFSKERDRLLNEMEEGDEGDKINYVNFLFDVAMKIRNTEIPRAIEILREIIGLDEKHYEARLKLSYRYVLDSAWDQVFDLLEPVAYAEDSTMLQKKRAFTNLSCASSCNSSMENHLERAISYAEEGIALDGTGTFRLWDNYASSCKKLGRYDDAKSGYVQSQLLNPQKSTRVKISEMEEKAKRQKKKNGGISISTSMQVRGSSKKGRSATAPLLSSEIEEDGMGIIDF